MKWKEFSESNKEYPEKIVKEFIGGFPSATKFLLTLISREIIDIERVTSGLKKDFQFEMFLISEYIPDYRFNVLIFGYNVELFPVNIILEESIYNEIYDEKMKYKQRVKYENEEDIKLFLEKVFQSSRFNEVVAGLMKIAQKNKIANDINR